MKFLPFAHLSLSSESPLAIHGGGSATIGKGDWEVRYPELRLWIHPTYDIEGFCRSHPRQGSVKPISTELPEWQTTGIGSNKNNVKAHSHGLVAAIKTKVHTDWYTVQVDTGKKTFPIFGKPVMKREDLPIYTDAILIEYHFTSNDPDTKRSAHTVLAMVALQPNDAEGRREFADIEMKLRALGQGVEKAFSTPISRGIELDFLIPWTSTTLVQSSGQKYREEACAGLLKATNQAVRGIRDLQEIDLATDKLIELIQHDLIGHSVNNSRTEPPAYPNAPDDYILPTGASVLFLDALEHEKLIQDIGPSVAKLKKARKLNEEAAAKIGNQISDDGVVEKTDPYQLAEKVEIDPELLEPPERKWAPEIPPDWTERGRGEIEMW